MKTHTPIELTYGLIPGTQFKKNFKPVDEKVNEYIENTSLSSGIDFLVENSGDKKEFKVTIDRRDWYQRFERFIILTPETYFFHIWDWIGMLFCIGSSILYSYFGAFRNDVEFRSSIDYFD